MIRQQKPPKRTCGYWIVNNNNDAKKGCRVLDLGLVSCLALMSSVRVEWLTIRLTSISAHVT